MNYKIMHNSKLGYFACVADEYFTKWQRIGLGVGSVGVDKFLLYDDFESYPFFSEEGARRRISDYIISLEQDAGSVITDIPY